MTWGRGARRAAGFTLLEVLVAIAILGLGLTVILSSQVGLFAGVNHTRNISFAANLLRCRMAEVELELLKEGYPVIDQHEEGPCCEDDPDPNFHCTWKVEVIELPEPTLTSEDDPLGALAGDGEGMGPLGTLMQLQQSAASGEVAAQGMDSMSEMFSEGLSGGVQGIAAMAMTLVYPQLKPMLEASIRKVTVSVGWKEGRKERDLTVVQYVASPMQGGIDPDAAEQLEAAGDLMESAIAPLTGSTGVKPGARVAPQRGGR
jgi:general secretion pathway protein I